MGKGIQFFVIYFFKCLPCFEADDACDFLDVWADETRFARVGVSGPTCDLWRGQLAPSGSRTFSSSPFCPPHYHRFFTFKSCHHCSVAIFREDSRHHLGLWLFLRHHFRHFSGCNLCRERLKPPFFFLLSIAVAVLLTFVLLKVIIVSLSSL